MKNCILLAFLLFCINYSIAQEVGDTIVVESFTFDNGSRDLVADFPNDPNLTFEKILLRYNMRCKDALVSTSTQRNLGCGEWDYSCNTYLADSSKPEILAQQIPSHYISNFTGTSFPYVSTPVYDYYREMMTETEITSTLSENSVETSTMSEGDTRIINTENLSGKSQFLYTAQELSLLGLVAGNIDGLSIDILGNASNAKFLKIKMKHSQLQDLSSNIELEGYTEVYYNHAILVPNQTSRFQFSNPFIWDGNSNILVEFNFANNNDTQGTTEIAGEITTPIMGVHASEESEFLLNNNSYIETSNYKGVEGNTNRTIEAWIKVDTPGEGEICSWGTQTTGAKWTFRTLTSGELRLEVTGGGTVSTTKVNDGNWHHVACVLDGNNLSDVKFYIDGKQDVNSVVGNIDIVTNITNGIPVRISRGTNNRYFNGEIDEVKIWDTALSETTVESWMRRELTNDHPNYDNLQLYYQFEGNGNTLTDSSPNGIEGTLIGIDYRTSFADGNGLFKEFKSTNVRPKLTLYQGDYMLTETTTLVERPFTKVNQNLVTQNSIIPGTDSYAEDDEINSSTPILYWTPEENIFDPITGDLLETRTLIPDGTIDISMLDYKRRFPFYNELVSFVTPYGIGLDLGNEGASWYMDMTDYVHILKGKKRLLMTLGGQNQEEMDLDFLFIVGTPPRDVLEYEQIWQGTNRIGIARIFDIQEDIKFTPVTMQVPADAESYKIKSSITGHGSEGEFAQNGGTINHYLEIDGTRFFQWRITQECDENPIFPQGGTWVYDRQGWCPGERSLIEEHDLKDILSPGDEFVVDYDASTPPVSTGDYRYHVSHQFVSYGPANHTLDAAVVEIVAPNNLAEYTRVGTICANPQVRIQNTGETPLTSLVIKYWLNDSFTPQEYEWTGDLAFMATELVTIPSPRSLWLDIQNENNKFHVEISQPNQANDEYPNNNSFASDITIPEVLPSDITVRVRTNSFPQENSYQLVDANGDVVGANNLGSANSTTEDDYNLPDGCFKLIFNDSAGDGLAWWANPNQGIGSVAINDANGAEIIEFNPDFGGGFEYSFATSFTVSAEEIEFLTSLKVFPNPTQDYITIEGDNLESTKVSIVDLSGKLISLERINNTENSISFSTQSLLPGTYFVSFANGDLVTTRKFIKL